MSLQLAVVTPAGGTSAGVGIAVARHTGLARDMDMPGGAGTDHRVQVRHWSGVCSGGIHLLCMYLHDGEGLSKRNLDILQEMAFVIARLRGPWICGGDFNLSTAELEQAGWLQLVGGVAMAPQGPTCGDRCIDFSWSSGASAPMWWRFSGLKGPAPARIARCASSWMVLAGGTW